MSEKIYACLMRLFPRRFRREYTAEALQLVQDRLRDERGVFRRMRLWWDLVTDLRLGLSLAWRNCVAVERTAAVSTNDGGGPCFRMLEGEHLRPASILWGSTLTVLALVAFGFLMSRATSYAPQYVSHGPESPINAVMERLNRATSTESIGGGDARNAQVGAGMHSAPQTHSTRAPEEVSAVPAAEARGSGFSGSVPFGTWAPQARVSESGTSTNARWASGAIATASRGAEAMVSSATNPRAGAGDGRSAGSIGRAHSIAQAHSIAEAHAAGQAPLGAAARPEDAVNAMMELFRSHDVVMFGEVHGDKQEYEWLCKLVKTPEFANHVDDIVVEFGNGLYQGVVDRYVAGQDVPFSEVQKAWRNMVADTEPVSPVYGWLYRAVREANLQHPDKRIRLLMGSPAADWSKIRSAADLAPYEAEREQRYAQVVRQEVLAKHRRALLIMGAWHFLRGHDEALAYELARQEHRALPALDRSRMAPGYIERQLRTAGANPYLVVFGTNVIDGHGDVDHRFDGWTAPVMVPLANNWVGELAAQPVLTGGHAQAIPISLGEQADALLYVAPCSALKRVYLSHAELDGSVYGMEMVRRDRIELGRQVGFEYGEVPECVK